jgi:hypothetical protein
VFKYRIVISSPGIKELIHHDFYISMGESITDIRVGGVSVWMGNGMNFESFAAQFQRHTSVILCLITKANSMTMRYYQKEGPFPKDITFVRKEKRDPIEYYFRDSDSQYCVFSRENALRFYPKLNEVDPDGRSEIIPRLFPSSNTSHLSSKRSAIIEPMAAPITEKIIQPYVDNIQDKTTATSTIVTTTYTLATAPDKVIIIDQGAKYVFPNPNYPVEIKTYQPE